MSIQSRAATAGVVAEQRRADAERLARQAEIEQRTALAHEWIWRLIDDGDADVDIISVDENVVTMDVLGSAEDDAKFRVQVRVPTVNFDIERCTANLLAWSSSTGRWYDNCDGHPIRFHDMETLGVGFARIDKAIFLQLHEEPTP